VTVIHKKRLRDGSVSLIKEHVYNKTISEAAMDISMNREVKKMQIKKVNQDEIKNSMNHYLDQPILKFSN
jgi:hypothetical protein